MRSMLHRHRRAIAEAAEALIAAAALACAFLLRFEFAVPAAYLGMLLAALPLVLAVKVAVFRAFGLRHLAWRHIGFHDLVRIGAASAAASGAAAAAVRLAIGPAFPRSIYILDFVLCLLGKLALRAAIRMLLEAGRSAARAAPRRALIYGAGQAGVRLLAEIRAHPELGYRAEAFLDDDPAKRSMRVYGLKVAGGRAELAEVARRLAIDEILIALPAASGHDLTEILEQCHAAGVPAKRVPALAELIENRVLVDQIREVRLEDLLDRAPACWPAERARARLAGQVVLVTGAGGSIGSELCRQIARLQPAALVGFDHAETALYEIEQELRERAPDLVFHAEVGSIRSARRLEALFRQYRPHAVYHAAAYKHVPMMERHLFEAVANNVFGTHNLARAAVRWRARDFVLVSSDKAVRPVNVMGATKRLAELVCLAEAARAGRTKIAAVRFGNVLGSNGSVIPRFRRQIARGGPLTVTHPEMRRYFMTIPEAAQLVLEAGAMGAGGEIFVLEMGEPVRILDLARKLVLLSGLRPGADIPIVFTGPRPGEKMYEELSAYEENTAPTPHAQIRVFTGPAPDPAALGAGLRALRTAVAAEDAAGVVMSLKDLVPEYNPSGLVLRRALGGPPPAARRRAVAAT
jgi:FlaA1/EpsC-like NDP-sugar epimerase